jgi:hypothetical protein
MAANIEVRIDTERRFIRQRVETLSIGCSHSASTKTLEVRAAERRYQRPGARPGMTDLRLTGLPRSETANSATAWC